MGDLREPLCRGLSSGIHLHWLSNRNEVDARLDFIFLFNDLNHGQLGSCVRYGPTIM